MNFSANTKLRPILYTYIRTYIYISYPCIGLDRPRGLQNVEAPRTVRYSARDCGKAVSHRHCISLCTFCTSRSNFTITFFKTYFVFLYYLFFHWWHIVSIKKKEILESKLNDFELIKASLTADCISFS